MKTRHLTSFIAVGALLPLAAWGDDTRSQTTIQREAYDPRPSETRSGPPTPRTEETRPAATASEHSRATTGAFGASDNLSTPAPTTGTGIERVTPKQLEQRVTAAELIGTKVVDREGQEIGKVKDIGLASVAPQLAPAGEARETSRADVPASATTTSADSGLSQPWTARTDEKEARVFVRPSRALEAGDALVAIPATQLHREGDALRVDLSREELRAIVSEREAGRVSMSR